MNSFIFFFSSFLSFSQTIFRHSCMFIIAGAFECRKRNEFDEMSRYAFNWHFDFELSMTADVHNMLILIIIYLVDILYTIIQKILGCF